MSAAREWPGDGPITYGVVGSRYTGAEWETKDRAKSAVWWFVENLDPIGSRIVTGDAAGVDTWVRRYARRRGIEVEVVPADWERLGRRAGLMRNPVIIGKADVVVAFWDGISPGTKNSITHARHMCKPLVVLEP